jgi:hypothetical protein
MGDRRDAYRGLVVKHEKIRPIGRTRSRWENNIKMDFLGFGGGAWSVSVWFRIGTGGEIL